MEPAAQVLHLGVYEIEIIRLVDMVAPHGFCQRGLIDHMVRAAHKIVEDVVLLAQQFHLAPGHLHTAAVGVEADIPHVEALLPVALVTAHDAPDTGAQFREVEGFGQVVVGPQFEALDLVVERVAGRNDDDSRLPALDVRPPLLREHRLYQADWLLRYYDFSAWELLTEEEPNFDPYLDPKCTWAVRHPEFFPVEINTAPKAALLRIPGIGPKSALRILSARRQQHLGMAELKRMGVVLKRAQYFITCNGRAAAHGTRQEIAAALLDPKAFAVGTQQLSLDDFTPKVLPDAAPAVQKLAAAGMPARQAAYEVKQEALQCLTRRM